MTFTRRTIAQDVQLEGFGLHSGAPVRVNIHPGEHGIRFQCLIDWIRAIPENVTDTTRCTRLGMVSTIEHLMSALAALEITDVDVELDAPELPALDGSAREYFTGLKTAGSIEIGEARIGSLFARVFHPEPYGRVAVATGDGRWRYTFDTGNRWPHMQEFETDDVVADYPSEIAPARTFGFETEVEAVKAAGLAQGLDLDKALLLGAEGYVNEPRFPDEPARHKMLDLIGDLYLAGVPIRLLSVVAERSGHTANVETAKLLRDAVTIHF